MLIGSYETRGRGGRTASFNFLVLLRGAFEHFVGGAIQVRARRERQELAFTVCHTRAHTRARTRAQHTANKTESIVTYVDHIAPPPGGEAKPVGDQRRFSTSTGRSVTCCTSFSLPAAGTVHTWPREALMNLNVFKKYLNEKKKRIIISGCLPGMSRSAKRGKGDGRCRHSSAGCCRSRPPWWSHVARVPAQCRGRGGSSWSTYRSVQHTWVPC
jgi:hypothetical protein